MLPSMELVWLLPDKPTLVWRYHVEHFALFLLRVANMAVVTYQRSMESGNISDYQIVLQARTNEFGARVYHKIGFLEEGSASSDTELNKEVFDGFAWRLGDSKNSWSD